MLCFAHLVPGQRQGLAPAAQLNLEIDMHVVTEGDERSRKVKLTEMTRKPNLDRESLTKIWKLPNAMGFHFGMRLPGWPH